MEVFFLVGFCRLFGVCSRGGLRGYFRVLGFWKKEGLFLSVLFVFRK